MMFVPALLMGLLGSAHCAVMCGGVASTMCGKPRATFGFNIGRVVTYTLLGAVAGAFGALVPSFAIVLRPLAAVVLLGLGLHLAGITNVFMKVEKVGLPVWKRLAPLTKRSLPSVALGASWGFVPCGLVYGALSLAALTETAGVGALTMLAFGLGTFPTMTLVAALARSLVRFRRTAGVLVLILGVHQTTLAFASADLSVTGAHCHP